MNQLPELISYSHESILGIPYVRCWHNRELVRVFCFLPKNPGQFKLIAQDDQCFLPIAPPQYYIPKPNAGLHCQPKEASKRPPPMAPNLPESTTDATASGSEDHKGVAGRFQLNMDIMVQREATKLVLVRSL
jgi:hypothetical protein